MNRVTLAAVRGARIEMRYVRYAVSGLSGDRELIYGQWQPCTSAIPLHQDVTDDYGAEYRVHPDDEHLQYGSISTVLREWAEDGTILYTYAQDTTCQAMARRFVDEEIMPFRLGTEEGCGLEEHLVNVLLIMAEFLADEGM